MKDRLLRCFKIIEESLVNEEGQDLVEYALVFTMIALGTAAGMESLDVAIVQVFNHVGDVFAGALQGVTPS
jgi:Flp pilus assembly pilin Flp